MLSIRCNSRVKSWRNKKKKSAKNNKSKFFINNYNWKRINFSSEKNVWKKLEKNNWAIDLHVLYAKEEKIYILLMFQNINISVVKKCFNDSKWRRMALSCSKKTINIIKRKTSKHHRGFYFLNCLLFQQRTNMNLIKKFEKKKKKKILMSSEDTKILKFNQYQILKIHLQQK